jgi:transcriptional regulator with XRE-family HTH domain
MQPDKKLVGLRIRTAREELNLSLAEFARRVGAKDSTAAWRWESGQRLPGTGFMNRIAEVLDVPASKLLAPPIGVNQAPPTEAERVLMESYVPPNATDEQRTEVLAGLRRVQAAIALRTAAALPSASAPAEHVASAPSSSAPPPPPPKRRGGTHSA